MADASSLVEIVGKETVSGPAKAASTALAGVEAAAGKMGGALAGVATAAARTAVSLAAIGGAGIAAGLTAATASAAGFEKQMSAVGAVSGASADQLKQLNALALQLGADTSFSASEAAKGIEELAKAGVSMADIMGGAAKASLDLAAAGGVSVGEAAEIASNAMNVFNIKGADMAHVADMIAGAANASAIDVNDYKFALAAAGSVAASVGISFDDLSTAIAVMGQAGIKGSDAGTSLKTMLLNLTPSTKQQLEVARQLGIVTADGANKFFDASGKAKSLAEISQVLQDATKGLTEQQKLQALQTLFGTDAIRAATIMAKQGAGGFGEMAAAIGKISAGDVAAARLDNLAGSIEKFKGSAETAAITVGQHLLAPLRRLVDVGTTLLNTSLPALDKYGAMLGTALDALVTRVTTAGPAVNAFGATVVNLGRYFHALVQDGDYLNDWLTHLPPRVAAVAETVGRGLVGAFGMARAEVPRLVAMLRDTFAQALEAGQRALPVVREALADLLPVAIAVGRALVTNVTDTFRFLVTRVLPPVASIVGQTARVFLDTLLPVWQETVRVARGVLGDTLTWLADEAWPNLLDIAMMTANFWRSTILPTVADLAGIMRQTLGETLYWLANDVWPLLRSAAELAWRYFAGTIAPQLPAFAAQVREVLGGALVWVATQGWPLLVQAGQAAAAWLTGTAVPAIMALADWLGPKIQAVIAWVTQTGWPMLVSAGQAVTAWAMDTAVPALTTLVDWLGPRVGAAVTWLTQTGWPAFVTAATAVSDWVTQTAIPALTPLVEWLGDKLKAAASWFIDTGWPAITTAAAAFSDWVRDTAVPAVTDLYTWLSEKLTPVVQWFIDTGWPALKEIGGTVVTMWQDMTTWVGNLYDKLTDRGVWTDLSAAVRDLWDAGKVLVETFWPEMASGSHDAWEPTNAIVEIAKVGAEVFRAFAAGVKATADALAELKRQADQIPDWLKNIGKQTAINSILPGLGPILAPGSTIPQSGTVGTSGQRVNLSSVDTSSRSANMQSWAPALLQAQQDKGVNAAALWAIIAAENGGGQSSLSRNSNNYFSISAVAGRTHQQGVDAGGRFAKYDSPQESLEDFLALIEKYYPDAWANRNDPEKFFQGLVKGGYIADEPGFPTSTWVKNLNSNVPEFKPNQAAINAVGAATRMSMPQGMAGIPDMARFAIGNQWELGLPYDDAAAACGPAAVAIFMQMTGRTPNREEVVAIAARNGWTASAGMGGPQAFMNTLSDLGVQYAADWTPSQQEAAASISSGHAVAFSTAGGNVPLSSGHYFVAQGYDAASGKFDLGETGGPDPDNPDAQHALAHGSRYMTYDEIVAYAGPVQALVTLMGQLATAAAPAAAGIQTTGMAAQEAATQTQTLVETQDASAKAQATVVETNDATGKSYLTLGDTIGIGLGTAAAAVVTSGGQMADSAAGTKAAVVAEAQEMASGVGDATGGMTQEMLAAMEAARQQAIAEARAMGQDVGGGVAEGIDNAQSDIQDSLQSVLSDALGAVSDSFDIHSPSGKTRRELGRPLGAGIAAGLADMAGEVGAAMHGVVPLDSLGLPPMAGRGEGGADPDALAASIARQLAPLINNSGRDVNVYGAGMDELVDTVRRVIGQDNRNRSLLTGAGRVR